MLLLNVTFKTEPLRAVGSPACILNKLNPCRTALHAGAQRIVRCVLQIGSSRAVSLVRVWRSQRIGQASDSRSDVYRRQMRP